MNRHVRNHIWQIDLCLHQGIYIHTDIQEVLCSLREVKQEISGHILGITVSREEYKRKVLNVVRDVLDK